MFGSGPIQIRTASTGDATKTLSGSLERVLFQKEECLIGIMQCPDEGKVRFVAYGKDLSEVGVGSQVTFEGKMGDSKYGRQFRCKPVKVEDPASPYVGHRSGSLLADILTSQTGSKVGSKTIERLEAKFADKPGGLLDVLTEPESEKLLYNTRGIGKKLAKNICDLWTELEPTYTFLEQRGASFQSFDQVVRGFLRHKHLLHHSWKVNEVDLTSSSLGKEYISFLEYDEHKDNKLKLFSKASSDVIQILTGTRPYDIVSEVKSIGFPQLDAIIMHLKLCEPDSPARFLAATSHYISKLRQDHGHLCIPQEQLETEIMNGLGIKVRDLSTFTKADFEEFGVVSVQLPEGGYYYYLKPDFNNETGVLHALCDILLSKDGEGPAGNTEPVKTLGDLQLSLEQQAAVSLLCSSRVSVLTGFAGTGKTTIIKAVLEQLRKKPVLVAPTGRAAKRVSSVTERPATTIHRLLQPEAAKDGFRFTVNKTSPLPRDRVIIIDEASMLSFDITNALLQAVSPDSHVIFVGDPAQLHPVEAGTMFMDLIYSGVIPIAKLTTAYRQFERAKLLEECSLVRDGYAPNMLNTKAEDGSVVWLPCARPEEGPKKLEEAIELMRSRGHTSNDFIHLLGRRDGLNGVDEANGILKTKFNPVERKEELNGFKIGDFVRNAKSGEYGRIVHIWEVYDTANARVEFKMNGELSDYEDVDLFDTIWVVDSGDDEKLSTKFCSRLLFGEEYRRQANEMSINDKVMCTKNDYGRKVFNGETGCIVNIYERGGHVYYAIKWDTCSKPSEYMLGELESSVVLSFATTVHKAQGSEYPVVLLSAFKSHGRVLNRNLLYTGMSRARNLLIIIGEEDCLRRAAKKIPTKRISLLAERLKQSLKQA
eukprot:CAMPEP_0203755654 /NCGR_PEP_ID=MMETSP0098-20131031/9063_1 /ASSEMBLY_ACC=CAM_ASM_000208 /TAXON_ID=96639 /ORGANISM=" , Strain NY0313808BC1" /LENGTH=876 /DNA_ID=CAMNT_0050647209 /DNA_START=217 /DNA_END=2847 /DNA_ORIENTATION=-